MAAPGRGRGGGQGAWGVASPCQTGTKSWRWTAVVTARRSQCPRCRCITQLQPVQALSFLYVSVHFSAIEFKKKRLGTRCWKASAPNARASPPSPQPLAGFAPKYLCGPEPRGASRPPSTCWKDWAQGRWGCPRHLQPPNPDEAHTPVKPSARAGDEVLCHAPWLPECWL